MTSPDLQRDSAALRESDVQHDEHLNAVAGGRYHGAPLIPLGDPMRDGLGPAAYANRADRVDLTVHGDAKIVPMRADPAFYIEPRDPDPRGYAVYGADDALAGTIVDVWVDRSEPQVRYYEVELTTGDRRVLLPAPFARVRMSDHRVKVHAITAAQFTHVPQNRTPDVITLLEEDMVQAYFAGGHLYAFESRAEPLL